MKIVRVDIDPFRIPFRRPLATATGTVRERCGVLLRLHGDDGRVGRGEASPHPAASPAVLREARQALDALRHTLGRDGTLTIDRIASPVARAAFNMAWLDLCAQGAGVRLAQLLGDVVRERVPVNATLDERDPERAATAARDYAARGFKCIKLKIAPHDVEGEVARLCAIRAVVGDALRIRADANGGWTVEQALAALPRLAVYGLEYVEQPVVDIAGLAVVRRAGDVPIAADESVTDVASVEAIAAAGAADIIVIKPTLLGLRGAVEVAHAARRCGLDVIVTSLLDTSIGITGAVHLAATLPDPLRACGLATAALLAGDLVAQPPTVMDGCLPVPHGPGLGVNVADAALDRWRDRAGT